MRSAVARYIIYGQICFYVGLLLCVLVRPAGLGANAGISYYGVYRDTILPYILALLGSAWFLIRAAALFNRPPLVGVRYVLMAMGLLTIGVLITPDSLSHFMDGLHRACGASLFSLQLLLSGWLIVRLRYNPWIIAGSVLELVAGIASFIYLSPPHGFLLQSQVVFQAAFGGVAIYALPRLQSVSNLAAEIQK